VVITRRQIIEQRQFYRGTDESLPVKFFEVNYDNYGGFAQLRYDWNVDLNFIFGLRFDYSTTYGVIDNAHTSAPRYLS
jgi:outer membrane receptor protein involved in Fe transport